MIPEYSLLGLLTAIVASIIGSLTSYGLIGYVGSPFELDIYVVLMTACAGVTVPCFWGWQGNAHIIAETGTSPQKAI